MNVWIDIDNSPHVPFFIPILRALRRRGDSIVVTSRSYAQTRELLNQANIDHCEISSHAGASSFRKIVNLGSRSWQLGRYIKKFRPDVAVSHGSRAMSVTAKAMGIPNLLLFDYEWTEMQIFKRCATLMACPEALTNHVLSSANLPLNKIEKYNGLKEDVYLPDFVPDPEFRSSVGIADNDILVTIRPSSMTSNYHDTRSEDILRALIHHIAATENVVALVSPRTASDRAIVEQERLVCSSPERIRILEKAVSGLQLLYWSDVVVSGGGTMNREAALLGTPTFSMFTGQRPAIDEFLACNNSLRFITSADQVATIPLLKHNKSTNKFIPNQSIVHEIVTMIDKTVLYKA